MFLESHLHKLHRFQKYPHPPCFAVVMASICRKRGFRGIRRPKGAPEAFLVSEHTEEHLLISRSSRRYWPGPGPSRSFKRSTSLGLEPLSDNPAVLHFSLNLSTVMLSKSSANRRAFPIDWAGLQGSLVRSLHMERSPILLLTLHWPSFSQPGRITFSYAARPIPNDRPVPSFKHESFRSYGPGP